MYEGFSGQARKVIRLAHREAERLRQEYLGTEHLLLGVLREGSPGLVRLLAAFGTDPEQVYRLAEADLPRGSGVVSWDKLPLTPVANRALQYAHEAAEQLHHACVGPEHLLLGVVHEPDSSAAQILLPLGITLEKLRQELAALPEPANRDWMARPEPTAPGDPSVHELEAVVSAAPLPSPGLPVRESPAPAVEAQVRIPNVCLESPVVERQLEALQVVVCALGGALIGAARMGLPGAMLAAFGGSLVACLLIAVKSNFLARVVGLGAGITCGWLYGAGNIVLTLLCGVAGLVLGFCLGDWRKLMGLPQTVAEDAAKVTVETFTASESAVKKTVETFTERI